MISVGEEHVRSREIRRDLGRYGRRTLPPGFDGVYKSTDGETWKHRFKRYEIRFQKVIVHPKPRYCSGLNTFRGPNDERGSVDDRRRSNLAENTILNQHGWIEIDPDKLVISCRNVAFRAQTWTMAVRKKAALLFSLD